MGAGRAMWGGAGVQTWGKKGRWRVEMGPRMQPRASAMNQRAQRTFRGYSCLTDECWRGDQVKM